MVGPEKLTPVAQFYRTDRGIDHAVFIGYTYRIASNNQPGGKQYWCCQVKGCHGRIHTKGPHVVFSQPHSHAPDVNMAEKLSLTTARVRADLLYSVVAKAPREHLPILVSILQNLMDRVVQHVTGGSIMCVQIIPVDSDTRTSELLNLSDLVSSMSQSVKHNIPCHDPPEKPSKNVTLKPCSVRVKQLGIDDLQNLTDQGLTSPVSLLDIKKEVMDLEEDEDSRKSKDDSKKSKEEQGTTRVLATGSMKKEQISDDEEEQDTANESTVVNKGERDNNEEPVADSDDTGYDVNDDVGRGFGNGTDDDVMEFEMPTKPVKYDPIFSDDDDMTEDEDQEDDTASDDDDDDDDEWMPGKPKKKSKTPRKRRRLNSGHHPGFKFNASKLYSSDNKDNDDYGDAVQLGTLRRNMYLKAQLYENYDLDAKFDETVQRRCFLCSTQSVIEVSEVDSLSSFVDHITDAYHLQYTRTSIRIMKCPVCEMQIRNVATEQDGPEKHQILRLAGVVLQHLESEHGFDTENTFMCKYQCDKCVHSTFECQNFLEHIASAHEDEGTEKTSQFITLDKFESYPMDAEFAEGINSSCPFCPADSAHRATKLQNFVEHMREAQGHVTNVDGLGGTMWTLYCPECQLEFRNRALTTNVADDIQVLRLVGKAVKHMMSEHSYCPDEAFIPKYQCDICTVSSYDHNDFLKHYSTNHVDTPPRKSNADTDAQLAKYLPRDLTVPIVKGVDSECPFCPKDNLIERYKCNSLSDFLRHVREYEHIVHGGGPLYSISCLYCNKVEKSCIYDLSDSQVLKMIGRVVHHMHSQHDLAVSAEFLPTYQCEHCRFVSFSYTDFKDHVRRMHYRGKKGNANVADNLEQENIPGFRWFPERNVALNYVFADDVDSSCPFCMPDKAYKAKTMSDFIQHVETTGHVVKCLDGSYIKCQECSQVLKSHIDIAGNSALQTLRAIGQAAHHLYEVHKCRFEEGFLPVYECSKCVYNSYSGELLTEHKRFTHRGKLHVPMKKQRIQKPIAEVTIKPTQEEDAWNYLGFAKKSKNDLCNLHLGNSIYENHNKTIFSFDELLDPELDRVCPLCPESMESFTNMKHFATHCAETHVLADNSLITLDCPECETTLACKTYKRDEPLSLALALIGKWAEHRFRKHSWVVPKFMPFFKCHGCVEFSTYSPRGCVAHIHTPGKCRVNSGDTRQMIKPCPCCQKMVSHRSWTAHVQLCSKPENERKRTACPVCGKLFLDELSYHKSNLKNHIAVVHGDCFPHLCSICSTQFKRRNDLNRHMFMTHNINISKNEPLYCDQCDFKTLIRSQYRRHLQIHDEAQRVTCHYCGKQYKGEGHLKRHIEDVHEKGEEQYRCNQCSYSTNSKRYLQKHIRWHDSTKVGAGHWCTICNYNARFPSVLKFHMKNVHKLDMEGIDVEKHPSVKSIVLKRRYKNMKMPGESGTERMYSTSAVDHTVAVVEAALASRESVDGGGIVDRGVHMDGDSGDSSGMYAAEQGGGDLEPLVSAALRAGSCAQSTGYSEESSAGTIVSVAPTSIIPMPHLPELPVSTNGHHHHHHQHDPELGYSSAGMLSAPPAHNHHRHMGLGAPITHGAIPPTSVLGHSLSHNQQSTDYLYNPQLFGSFLQPQGLPPPQGLPHQYY